MRVCDAVPLLWKKKTQPGTRTKESKSPSLARALACQEPTCLWLQISSPIGECHCSVWHSSLFAAWGKALMDFDQCHPLLIVVSVSCVCILRDFLTAEDKEGVFNADHFPLWYKRAAEQVPGTFVYSIPFSTGRLHSNRKKLQCLTLCSSSRSCILFYVPFPDKMWVSLCRN